MKNKSKRGSISGSGGPLVVFLLIVAVLGAILIYIHVTTRPIEVVVAGSKAEVTTQVVESVKFTDHGHGVYTGFLGFSSHALADQIVMFIADHPNLRVTCVVEESSGQFIIITEPRSPAKTEKTE